MRKNIDLPEKIRWDLEKIATETKRDLKNFIQDSLIIINEDKNLQNQLIKRLNAKPLIALEKRKSGKANLK